MELKQFDGLPVRVTDTDGRVFEGEVRSIEPLEGNRLCPFYGAEYVPEEVRKLYRDLSHVWCAETCAPRMRKNWSPSNPTLGQCSITSFLAQDFFGGQVRGALLPNGDVHCFNVLDGKIFNLTSGQLEEHETDYAGGILQSREEHFAKAEKRERYELLRRLLTEYRAERGR